MIISWNVTDKCNLFCQHCYRDAGKQVGNELTTEQGFSLLNEIAKAGFKILVFSGGEPFLRKDIFDLTRQAASLGLRPVYGTNGTLLTKEMAKKIKAAGGASVAISLHMVNKEKLDRFCGVAGSFSSSVQAMKNCKAIGMPFQVNTTVFNKNFDEIEDICDFAKDLGAKSHHVLFMVPTGRAKNIEQECLSKVQTEQLIKRLLKKREELNFDIRPTCAPQFMRIARQLHKNVGRHTRGCLAGISYCSIIPNGDVWPCPYFSLKVGNVLETPFSEIWKNSSVFRNLRSLDYSGKCGICEFKEICGGCRARAQVSYNDYMASDNWCSYKEEYSFEKRN